MRWNGLMLLALVLPACPREQRHEPRDWPALPATGEAAARLVKQHTRRPVNARVTALPGTAEATLALLRSRELVAGWAAVVATLQREMARARRSVLLVGTTHDAGGQVAAFRRLTGPAGIANLDAVGVELMAADGRWGGVPREAQRGLSRPVARYLATGDRAALQRVRADLPRSNYTAWKYRYVDEVTDLLVTARAAGRRLVPCDMPRRLQHRVADSGLVDRLRELHGVLALGLAGDRGPARVALLWGQGHLAPDALARFFPAATRVIPVYLLGHRPGPAGLELKLRGRLHLADPLLVPLEGDGASPRYLLLLDGPVLGARVRRARDPLERPLPAGQRHELSVTVEQPARLVLAGKQHELPVGTTRLALAPGSHAYMLESGGRVLAGALTMPRDGALALMPRVAAGEVELVLRGVWER